MPPGPKRIIWVRGSRGDLKRFPQRVRSKIGYALWVAQQGGRHRDVKALRGFGGAGVLEMIADFSGDTYRAVYTVRFAEAIYVLHAFMKKSKSGISTPRSEIDLIGARLKYAEMLHRGQNQGGD
jgi:phage-related protein